MILKSYFDGANQPDADRFEFITIACACGTKEEWEVFHLAWSAVLDRHGADYLHTTDAVALRENFSREKGWDNDRVDALISDCVTIIENHIEIPSRIPEMPLKPGLFFVTLQIQLKDFVYARESNPSLPESVTELCATESLGFCFRRGRMLGAKWYHLYFDQGEPFYGHIYDRKNHRKARRAIPQLNKVVHLGESNMRLVPALQAADLFAWCISHHNRVTRQWHARLHRLPWQAWYLDYLLLINPKKGALEMVKSWKLPKRKLTPPPKPEG